MNSVNVLLLFSSADIGGAERSLSRMALFNKDSSVKYQLATFGSNGAWSSWVESNGDICQCFSGRISRLIRYIHINKIDVVYMIGFRLSLLLRFILPIFFRVKLVQGVRWNPVSATALDRIFRFTERFLSFLVDGYIVNSASAALTLSDLSIDSVELIYNGIPRIPKNIAYGRNKTVITVANMSNRKGYVEYLDVISDICTKVPEASFVFLGKDNLDGKIQRLIGKMGLSKNAEYYGFQEDIEPFMLSSSVFVLPSQYGEGCPTSILEAFSYSLPVIAYHIDGIPELVMDGIDGLLIDVGDQESFAEAIIKLLLDPNRAISMGSQGMKKVKSTFMIDNMLERHNRYFLGLI